VSDVLREGDRGEQVAGEDLLACLRIEAGKISCCGAQQNVALLALSEVEVRLTRAPSRSFSGRADRRSFARQR
jgi:hypothetical protein